MADMKDLSDALSDEFMSEVADNFFGTRKALDDAFDYFDEKVNSLTNKIEKLYRRSAYLKCMSLGGDNYRKFWISIDIDPEPFIVPEGYPCEKVSEKRPFSFTARGGFIKSFGMAYERLHESVEDYIVGNYIDSPDGNGKKILTANRTDLVKLCESINANVRKVNSEFTPSSILQFTKSLNPESAIKDKIGSSDSGHSNKFDNDMRFMEIDFASLGLPDFPLLPEEKKISNSIVEFCDELYSENKDLIKKLVSDFGCH